MVIDDWMPSCDLDQLRRRATLLATIRDFFRQRNVLEVETPLLCHSTGTDPQLDFFSTLLEGTATTGTFFLQTSPEFAMKRLLAAGSGSIYQICKAFRNGESGRFHNPEFTLLEWYRTEFKLTELMTEVADLLQRLLGTDLINDSPELISYQAVFQRCTGLDPLSFDFQSYQSYAREAGIPEAISICAQQHSFWLDFLFSHQIQPFLGRDRVTMVHHYPSVQSSLARVSETNPLVAERFEVFVQGIELGNGFYELADMEEQERRFDQEISERREQQLRQVDKDQRFLSALGHGLPECSGVAIGLDRVLMLMGGAGTIDDVLAFPVARA